MAGVPWGGSEELWYRAAKVLNSQGHKVLVNYKWWPKQARQLTELDDNGADLWLRMQPPTFWQKKMAGFNHWRSGRNGNLPNDINNPKSWVKETRPDAVLVTLGYHPDRIFVADDCIRFNIPYAINVQAASSFVFLGGDKCKDFRRWYQGAKKVFFVSQENQDKLETNLALKLDNAEIVDNPFNVDFDHQVPYPTDNSTFRLACVGRIHFQSKGQDLLVDVLKQQKWRDRNIEVSIFGKDQGQRFQLTELIKLHGLEDKIKIQGFVDGVSEIWKTHHALLLPSRYEGAALVIIEAMLSGRICITTDTGRNCELMDDGKSGFISSSPTVRELDETLERAWAERENWKSMGELAGKTIRERYSTDPVTAYAEKIKQLANVAVEA
jgi:glycosyltransferase involved in cell wall biosynthesis